MAHTRKPTMAITMGDPAGIGPEITLKTIQDERIPSSSAAPTPSNGPPRSRASGI